MVVDAHNVVAVLSLFLAQEVACIRFPEHGVHEEDFVCAREMKYVIHRDLNDA